MSKSEFQNYERLEAMANGQFNSYASASVLRYAVEGGWNSPLSRSLVPDYISFSPGFQVSSGVASGHDLSFTIITRGKDPGLYFNTTHNMGVNSAVEAEVGFSLGYGWTLHEPENFSSEQLGGWQISVGGAVAAEFVAGGEVSAGVDVGLDENNRPSTITTKFGVAVGVGVATPIEVSAGAGFATDAKRILGVSK